MQQEKGGDEASKELPQSFDQHVNKSQQAATGNVESFSILGGSKVKAAKSMPMTVFKETGTTEKAVAEKQTSVGAKSSGWSSLEFPSMQSSQDDAWKEDTAEDPFASFALNDSSLTALAKAAARVDTVEPPAMDIPKVPSLPPQQSSPTDDDVGKATGTFKPVVAHEPEPALLLKAVSSTVSADAGGWDDDDDALLGVESDEIVEPVANHDDSAFDVKQSSPMEQSATQDDMGVVDHTSGGVAADDAESSAENENVVAEMWTMTAMQQAVSLNGGDQHDGDVQSPEIPSTDGDILHDKGEAVQESVADSEMPTDDDKNESLDAANYSDTLSVNEIEAQQRGTEPTVEPEVVGDELHVGREDSIAAANDISVVVDAPSLNGGNFHDGTDQSPAQEPEALLDNAASTGEDEASVEKFEEHIVPVEMKTDVDEQDTAEKVAYSSNFEIGHSESEDSGEHDTSTEPKYAETSEVTVESSVLREGEQTAEHAEGEAMLQVITSEQGIPVSSSDAVATTEPSPPSESMTDDSREESAAAGSEEARAAVEVEQPESVAHDETAATPLASSTHPTVPATHVQHQDYQVELQRLRESHQAEVAALTKQHENQLQEALDSFNHDHCESQRREMEQRFMDQMRAKEEQLQELMRENEGYQLKVDALKREVTGTQALLEQR